MRSRRMLVSDIHLWAECFAVYAAVLAGKYPDVAPELFLYMKTIIRAHRNYEDGAWTAYDVAYRRQALTRRDLQWSKVDNVLYNEAFTGRARAIPRCRHCLGENHASADCAYAPAPNEPAVQKGDREQPSRLYYGQTRYPARRWGGSGGGQSELCHLFNKSECRFNPCRFQHVCSRCKGAHPLSECSRGRSPSPKRSRTK